MIFKTSSRVSFRISNLGRCSPGHLSTNVFRNTAEYQCIFYHLQFFVHDLPAVIPEHYVAQGFRTSLSSQDVEAVLIVLDKPAKFCRAIRFAVLTPSEYMQLF